MLTNGPCSWPTKLLNGDDHHSGGFRTSCDQDVHGDLVASDHLQTRALLPGGALLPGVHMDQVFHGIPNTPKGIRTPAASVKGRCPRPLDDGG